jgi:hypothetical protein
MGEHAQFGKSRQLLEVTVIDASYFEYVVGAHNNTVLFGLASCVIDDRGPGACVGVAALTGAVRMLRCAPLLGECFVSVGQGGFAFLYWCTSCWLVLGQIALMPHPHVPLMSLDDVTLAQ